MGPCTCQALYSYSYAVISGHGTTVKYVVVVLVHVDSIPLRTYTGGSQAGRPFQETGTRRRTGMAQRWNQRALRIDGTDMDAYTRALISASKKRTCRPCGFLESIPLHGLPVLVRVQVYLFIPPPPIHPSPTPAHRHPFHPDIAPSLHPRCVASSARDSASHKTLFRLGLTLSPGTFVYKTPSPSLNSPPLPYGQLACDNLRPAI